MLRPQGSQVPPQACSHMVQCMEACEALMQGAEEKELAVDGAVGGAWQCAAPRALHCVLH